MKWKYYFSQISNFYISKFHWKRTQIVILARLAEDDIHYVFTRDGRKY